MSVGESHFSDDHTLNLLEVMFRSPETAPGKIDVLCGLCFLNTVHLMLNEGTLFAFHQDARFHTLMEV